MAKAWLIFVVSSAAVFWFGNRLAANAEKRVRLTGLGGLWVGLIRPGTGWNNLFSRRGLFLVAVSPLQYVTAFMGI